MRESRTLFLTMAQPPSKTCNNNLLEGLKEIGVGPDDAVLAGCAHGAVGPRKFREVTGRSKLPFMTGSVYAR